MPSGNSTGRVRLSVDIDADLRRKIKIRAAGNDMSVRDFVIGVLRDALAEEESEAWSTLSDASFARDWGSEEDAVYDRFS